MSTFKKKPIKHFTDLIVWQKAHQLFIDLYSAIEMFPRKVGAKIVADQILRSCGSISANIAEGFHSRSKKQYLHYLDIAQRSGEETENWLYKVKDCKLADNKKVILWLNVSCEIQKMLESLMRSIRKAN